MRLDEYWPALPLDAWKDTCETLQLWTQIVGKIRLVQTAWMNHSWHVPLYVTARGLTTSPIAHVAARSNESKTGAAIGSSVRIFEIELDFIAHRLIVQSSDGAERTLPLRAQAVADFYAELFQTLEAMQLPVTISGTPNEIENAIPFAQDRQHASYDPEYANRFWRVLAQADRILRTFRAEFVGKASPVHFFWGSFDLAVTRFSGRRAPLHPGGVPNLPDWVAQEAYSHEVSSAGFWPGGGPHPFPLFYSYAYPEPPDFNSASVRPREAFYSTALREFVLPYDAVRESASPDQTLLEFLTSTYDAAADLAKWDRKQLERDSSNDLRPKA